MNYVGSPMYSIIAEHAAGLIVPALAALAALAVAWRRPTNGKVVAYRALAAPTRLLVWLLVLDGAMHLGMAAGHEPAWGVGFLVFGLAELLMAGRLLRGVAVERWVGRLAVVGILAYALPAFGGEAPDQVGLLSKMMELGMLAVAGSAVTRRRLPRLRHVGGVALAAVVSAAAAWTGAFSAGGHGHHPGETPGPGVLLRAMETREPTAEERAATDRLLVQATEALRPLADLEVAAAAGYDVSDLRRSGYHADNPAFKGDGRVLDPTAPETLVYAEGPNGPVLVGAMFQMDDAGDAGPTPGGPLTVWHAHDHVCFSLVPPMLAGLTGPFGSCPLGTITMPITNEMIHIWTIPGAPDAFGDLDEEWLANRLAMQP